MGVLLSICTTSVWASNKSINTLKQQNKSIEQSIEENKKKLEVTKAQQKTVYQEIENLETTLSKVISELITINQLLEDTKGQIDRTEAELQEACKQREKYLEVIKKRIKYLHENGNIGYLQVLMQAKDFRDFLNRMQYIEEIMEYDQSVMEKMEGMEQNIQEQMRQLEDHKIEIEMLVKQQSTKKHSIEQQKVKKGALLTKLSSDEKMYYQQIKEWEEMSKKIEKEIIKLTQASTRKYGGGKVEWPVPNHYTISSQYGNRPSPFTGKTEFHTGIDIPAPTGAKVISAAPGVVIHAGYIRGYGNTIIIDHGSGLSSLYAHNSSLVVSNGQEVKRGDVIAKIGSTGYSTGPHSHFEVRVKGVHANPMNYVK